MLYKITVMELALQSIAFQWSSHTGGKKNKKKQNSDCTNATQTGFVEGALNAQMEKGLPG